jgi:hypothetical protein
MNKKHGLLFGFAVIAIAAMFTLTGCPTEADDTGGGNGNGGGVPSGTIKLAKVDGVDHQFTVELTGFKWIGDTEAEPGWPRTLNGVAGWLFKDSLTVSGAGTEDDFNPKIYSSAVCFDYKVVRDSDTKLTITLNRSFYELDGANTGKLAGYWGAGTLELKSNDWTKKASGAEPFISERSVGCEFLQRYTREGKDYDPQKVFDLNNSLKLAEGSDDFTIGFNFPFGNYSATNQPAQD